MIDIAIKSKIDDSDIVELKSNYTLNSLPFIVAYHNANEATRQTIFSDYELFIMSENIVELINDSADYIFTHKLPVAAEPLIHEFKQLVITNTLYTPW